MCRSDRSFYSRMGIFVQFTLLVLAFGSGGSLCDQTENRQPLESKMAELMNQPDISSAYDNLAIEPSLKAIDPTQQLRLDQLDKNIAFMSNIALFANSISKASEPPYLSPINCTRSGCRNVTVLGNTYKLLYENNEHGSDWIVFQSRIDGNNTVDFFRNWADYRNGFGTVNGEFWLGLETIHWLTSARNYSLLITLEDYKGMKKYARYDRFEIGAEWEGYNLKTLGAYNGTAGDGLDYQKGQKFTTFDRDQDQSDVANCAYYSRGGWWYNKCAYSNLNGLHQNVQAKTSMFFANNGDGTAYKNSRMMIKAV